MIDGPDSISHIKQAFNIGINGYITKSEAPGLYLQSICLVINGGTYIPREFIQSNNGYQNKKVDIILTPKQFEVLKQIRLGLSNKEIADNMNITVNTIKVHITAIYKQLGVANRVQSCLMAKKLAL